LEVIIKLLIDHCLSNIGDKYQYLNIINMSNKYHCLSNDSIVSRE